MTLKKKIFSWYKVFLVCIILGICLILSSCATCGFNKDAAEFNRFYAQLNKNSQVFKNKSLNEVDPEFWKQANAITVYIIYGDSLFLVTGASGTATSATIGEVLPLAGGLLDFGGGARFQRKINGFMQAHNWEISDYFIGVLKKEINLPREVNISFVKKENGVIREAGISPSMEISDKDIVIFISALDLYMLGEHLHLRATRVPLRGEAGITIALGKAWREFIQKYNGYLPLAPSLSLSVDYKMQWYSELRKISPDMYMGSITKQTESYEKGKWTGDSGVFLEQQLKAMIEDLAKKTAKLLKKD